MEGFYLFIQVLWVNINSNFFTINLDLASCLLLFTNLKMFKAFSKIGFETSWPGDFLDFMAVL